MQEFDQLVGQGNIVVADFYADWCGPCRALSPVLETVAAQFQGRVAFCKINVDTNPKFPSEHSVRGIPTLLLMNKGALVARHVGAMDQDQLIKFLANHLEKTSS